MFSFFGSKAKEELALVFDIGSSSVGGALFHTSNSGVPRIIHSIREPIILIDDLDIDQFLLLTMKALDVVAGKILAEGLGAPKHIFCVLSAPWHVSQTRVVNMEKNTPFVFNTALADSLTEKEIKLFEEEHLAKYANDKSAIRPIELKNMKTMLNGYETLKPLNQKTKVLAMTLFISMSPEQFLQKIEETIGRHFHFKFIKFSSFAMASFTVVRDLFINQENFLLVDIGGELTDISMTKKDVLKSSISYPLGINFIIRELSKGLHVSLEEAKSSFSLYKDGHMSLEAKKQIEPVLDRIKAEWLKKFQESLANLSNDISIPSNIFITTDADLADFFSDLIKKEQFNQYTLTESKFQTTFLGGPVLHGVAAFNDEVARDPFIIIECIYINRFLVK